MTYKIEVIMTPLTHDSPKKPYFWIIYSNTGTEGSSWCNHTAGGQKLLKRLGPKQMNFITNIV